MDWFFDNVIDFRETHILEFRVSYAICMYRENAVSRVTYFTNMCHVHHSIIGLLSMIVTVNTVQTCGTFQRGLDSIVADQNTSGGQSSLKRSKNLGRWQRCFHIIDPSEKHNISIMKMLLPWWLLRNVDGLKILRQLGRDIRLVDGWREVVRGSWSIGACGLVNIALGQPPSHATLHTRSCTPIQSEIVPSWPIHTHPNNTLKIVNVLGQPFIRGGNMPLCCVNECQLRSSFQENEWGLPHFSYKSLNTMYALPKQNKRYNYYR